MQSKTQELLLAVKKCVIHEIQKVPCKSIIILTALRAQLEIRIRPSIESRNIISFQMYSAIIPDFVGQILKLVRKWPMADCYLKLCFYDGN